MKDEPANRVTSILPVQETASMGETPVTQVISSISSSPALTWPLVLTALVAMAAMFCTSEYSPVFPVTATLLIAGKLAPWKLPPRRALSWAIRAGVYTTVIAVMGLPQQQHFRLWYFDSDYTNAIGGLIAAEMVIRLLELPPMNPGQVLLMSGLIMVAAGNTQDRRFMPILAPLYVVLSIFSLRGFSPRPRPQHKGLLTLRFAAAAVVILLGASLIRAVVGLDPEFQRWVGEMIREQPRGSDIGLSGSPYLGSVFNPVPSMDRILLIHGPAQERYLRVLAFDQLVNNVWHPSFHDDHKNYTHIPAADLHPGEVGSILRFELVGDTFDCLAVPLNSAGIITDTSLSRNQQGTLQFRAPLLEGSYEVILSRTQNHQGPLCLPPDNSTRSRYLQPPDKIDSRVIDLAKQVARDDPSPLNRVIRLAQYLRSTHQYSLEYQPPSSDPLADFILNNRAAHCEYFASSLVVMARFAGVPARMVTGYLAHEMHGENHMVVRDRDAHAWAECWIDGIGWMTFDATPSAGRPDVRFAPPSKWRLAWESVLDFPGMVHQWLSRLSKQQVLGFVFVCAGAVIAMQIVQSRRRNRASVQRPYHQSHQALVQVGRRFERWLKRRGVACQPNRTWRDHAISDQSPVCTQFLQAYDEARFGGSHGNQLSRLHELLDKLEHSGGQHHG